MNDCIYTTKTIKFFAILNFYEKIIYIFISLFFIFSSLLSLVFNSRKNIIIFHPMNSQIDNLVPYCKYFIIPYIT